MLHTPTRVQVIFKTVERCNLACRYCYYFFAGDESYAGRPPTTNRAVIDDLCRFISLGIDECGLAEIDIAFHGGEPMMQKLEDFEYACSRFNTALAHKVSLKLLIQTNAVLITDKWIDAFARHGVHVGISIDGSQQQNDRHRLDKHGRGSYDRVVRGLRKVQTAAAQKRLGVPSSISVVSADYDYRAVYRHLTEELGLNQISFLLPDLSRDNGIPPRVASQRYGQIFCDIFDEWAADLDAGKDVYVTQFSKYLRIYKSDPPPKPGTYRRGRSQIIVVQSDGKISIDDSLMVALDWRKSIATPSVTECTLKQFLSWPVVEEVDALQRRGADECIDCRYFGQIGRAHV